MISDETKISIAMELIDNKIGNCMARRRINRNEKIEKEYNDLILIREEIYKGNYNEINKIIDNEVRRDKID